FRWVPSSARLPSQRLAQTDARTTSSTNTPKANSAAMPPTSRGSTIRIDCSPFLLIATVATTAAARANPPADARVHPKIMPFPVIDSVTINRIIRATKPPTNPSDQLPREVLGRSHRRGNDENSRKSSVTMRHLFLHIELREAT
ncbi:MAG: hypothetical protein H6Q04_1964, partial [Acidobacteria bacterium]|nr:hypothetical protein [Acidobacteriota bacterium]